MQQPGTLIYVREGVLHQVLNTGVNLAEAVNVGSNSWNNMAHTFVACGCPYARVRSISPNPTAYQTGRGHTARVYEGPRDGCLHSAATRAQAQQHARTHSRRGSDRPKIHCRVCSAAYLTQSGLTRHQQQEHPGEARLGSDRRCPVCHRLFSASNLGRHRRRCLPREVTISPSCDIVLY